MYGAVLCGAARICEQAGPGNHKGLKRLTHPFSVRSCQDLFVLSRIWRTRPGTGQDLDVIQLVNVRFLSRSLAEGATSACKSCALPARQNI